MPKGVSINVGSSSQDMNGRGPIDPSDCSFDYLPIPERNKTVEDIPTYAELEWIDQDKLTFPNNPVHLDPEFETYTYGHTKRGFGDMSSLLDLVKDDYLFFHSTLSDKDDQKRWLTALIGYFEIENVIDCRGLTDEEIRSNFGDRFKENAHLKREDLNVDLLISGTDNSKLFDKAVPISSFDKPRELKEDFKDVIKTSTGKDIGNGYPWFRWTLKIVEPELLSDRS